MKSLLKTALLFACIPLSLSACKDKVDNALVCIETSNVIDYVEGKCFQSTYKNVLETLYLITLPNNPEANPEDYTYDFTWNYELKNSYFDFIEGLEGKTLISILRLGDNVLKLNINSACDSPNSTYGYIKVFRYAFTPNVKKLENTSLYAYVAIGEESARMVDKPVLNEDGTFA